MMFIISYLSSLLFSSGNFFVESLPLNAIIVSKLFAISVDNIIFIIIYLMFQY